MNASDQNITARLRGMTLQAYQDWPAIGDLAAHHIEHLTADNVRLQRLLDMRPPYYCHQCRCASCGNTFMVDK